MTTQKIIFKKRKVKSRKTGKISFTWKVVHTNGKVANHKYNRSNERDKKLKSFIEKIRKGEYEIQ